MTGKQILRADNLSKTYGALQVLRDFSYTFPNRGTVTLMGPSGCGKTTFLRLLAALEHPDGGEVRKEEGGKVSVVFQEDRLLEVLTARGNLCAVLPKDKQELADSCLLHSGLSQAADLFPAQMSGGMKRRLAIARAMAFEGDILLLDEPFKGLDLETKRQMMDFVFRGGEISGLRPPGLIIMVTHDVDEALGVSDHILLLKGTPLSIWKNIDIPSGNRSMEQLRQLRERLLVLLGDRSC